METKSNLFYAKTHEWASISDRTATVGVTDFAQDSLGDIVYVRLPEVGEIVTAGEAFSEIESVKAVSDVISPVTGTVTEINEKLLDEPELINDAPYDSWLIKVETDDDGSALMTAAEYEEHVKNEG